ncbi:MAG: NYN domain-containing protein [Actinomycetales bacterium]|nr:NYN domain-containing protein [Actinomycetales bacterium]
MTSTHRINSELITRRPGKGRHPRTGNRHKLSQCPATGLPRYRDRHQARDGARALARGTHQFEVHTFACPSCGGFHLEKTYLREPIDPPSIADPVEPFTSSLPSRKRRYFLVDIENPTRGAKATPEQVATFWAILKQQAPGIAPHDHVVVGAARSVVRKYRVAIDGPNVRWVTAANSPGAADRALLAAIDLYRVALNYDELVIVSGDHAFTDLARQAKTRGLTVHVITVQQPGQSSMLSRELADVADTHTVVRHHSRTLTRDNIAAILRVANATDRTHFEAA